MTTLPTNYYDVLQVKPTATADEIKTAFRRLARQHHPDLHPESEKALHTKKMQEINEAYSVLGSPEKRKQFDDLVSAPEAPPQPQRSGRPGDVPPTPDGAEGFSDFFRNMFGNASDYSSAGPASPSELDIEAAIDLSLEEVVHGVEKTFSVTITGLCPTCHGTGRSKTGYCPVCGGVGEVRRPTEVKARIPAGLTEGSRIRLKGQGNSGPAGRGDLYLQIRLKSHPMFSVEGRDLETPLVIAPWQAALGSEATVETVDGPLRIKIPRATHTGQRLRLAGKGLGKDGARGDLYVRIVIDVSTPLSPDQERLYKEFEALAHAKS